MATAVEMPEDSRTDTPAASPAAAQRPPTGQRPGRRRGDLVRFRSSTAGASWEPRSRAHDGPWHYFFVDRSGIRPLAAPAAAAAGPPVAAGAAAFEDSAPGVVADSIRRPRLGLTGPETETDASPASSVLGPGNSGPSVDTETAAAVDLAPEAAGDRSPSSTPSSNVAKADRSVVASILVVRRMVDLAAPSNSSWRSQQLKKNLSVGWVGLLCRSGVVAPPRASLLCCLAC